MMASSATQVELSPPPRTVTAHPLAPAIRMTDDTSCAEAGSTTQAGRRRAASGKKTRPSDAAYAALPGRQTLSPSASRSSRTPGAVESTRRGPARSWPGPIRSGARCASYRARTAARRP
jgi:hypothetical protein